MNMGYYTSFRAMLVVPEVLECSERPALNHYYHTGTSNLLCKLESLPEQRSVDTSMLAKEKQLLANCPAKKLLV